MSKPGDLYGRPWSRREYIICLHYYYQYQDEPIHTGSPRIIGISKIIGRTPASVVMRMENFASLDPAQNRRRKGLVNVNELCRRIFTEWSAKIPVLHECAEVLIHEAQAASNPTLFDPNPVEIPRAFQKYELMEALGDGGWGSVYSCINVEDQKTYAIKIIRTDRRWEHECLHRFRREIYALKAISHPNVIRIYEDNLNEQEDFPAYVMDYAETSLTGLATSVIRSDVCMRPILPTADAINVCRALLRAIETLHYSTPKVIHRDINPSNILRLPTGDWVLADFGLAKFLPMAPVSTVFVTTNRQGWGTEGYLAPEQFRDFRTVDERADIFSTGKVLWDLFSSQWPPPRRELTGLPAPIEAIFLRATEFERDGRYSTITELADCFEKAIETLGW